MYPEGTFITHNGLFHASPAAVFSLVYGKDWHDLDSNLPYSEFDWGSPQELRLLGSLLLCEKRESCYMSFYPIINYSPWLDVSTLNLKEPGLVTRVINLLHSTTEIHEPAYGHDAVALCLAGGVNLAPPSQYNLDRLHLFWRRIRPSNYVLMRGIRALIKADMLCHYREFWEEALLSIYVALDASFHLVMENLRSNGAINPTSHDAAVWLHKHFDAPFNLRPPEEVERYFEQFYAERIMALHPASRYGQAPFVPTMHDDVIHLRRSLREIFSYLISGFHSQDYWDNVQRIVRPQAKA